MHANAPKLNLGKLRRTFYVNSNINKLQFTYQTGQ